VLSKHVVAEIIMSPHTVHVLSKHVVAEIIMSPHTVPVLSTTRGDRDYNVAPHRACVV
jgi:hypothetical protein